MHFTTAIAIMAGLSATGSAFVIDTFSDTDCKDSVQTSVNIWDNSCATWPKGFKSFKIKTWGGSHQMGYFFPAGDCGNLLGTVTQGYVDSSTHEFKMGDCYDADDSDMNAIASYSAA
ncbi:hypothetical protein BDV18DRAFT_155692 [Aspergillus unguis]